VNQLLDCNALCWNGKGYGLIIPTDLSSSGYLLRGVVPGGRRTPVARRTQQHTAKSKYLQLPGGGKNTKTPERTSLMCQSWRGLFTSSFDCAQDAIEIFCAIFFPRQERSDFPAH
jgi:hypothetical protein